MKVKVNRMAKHIHPFDKVVTSSGRYSVVVGVSKELERAGYVTIYIRFKTRIIEVRDTDTISILVDSYRIKNEREA